MDENAPPEKGFDNPFRPPAEIVRGGQEAGGTRYTAGGAYVRQVRVVAVLLIVHGGLVLMAFASYVSVARQFMTTGPPLGPLYEDPRARMAWGSVGMAVVLLAVGCLQLGAGVRNLGLLGRGLGLSALAAGMITSITCCCAPTALALAFYGFIIYTHPAVAQACRLRESGLTLEEVWASFNV